MEKYIGGWGDILDIGKILEVGEIYLRLGRYIGGGGGFYGWISNVSSGRYCMLREISESSIEILESSIEILESSK